jgi:hypothetical protein
VTPPVDALTEELAALVTRAGTMAEGQRFGSDFLLLVADALTIGAGQCDAVMASLESAAFAEAAQALRDLAPGFAGAVARNPSPRNR